MSYKAGTFFIRRRRRSRQGIFSRFNKLQQHTDLCFCLSLLLPLPSKSVFFFHSAFGIEAAATGIAGGLERQTGRRRRPLPTQKDVNGLDPPTNRVQERGIRRKKPPKMSLVLSFVPLLTLLSFNCQSRHCCQTKLALFSSFLKKVLVRLGKQETRIQKKPTERNKEEEILIWKTKKKIRFPGWVDGFYIRFFFAFSPLVAIRA